MKNIKVKILLLLCFLITPAVQSDGAVLLFGKTQNALDTPFDNTTNGFISDNVQDAIEEIDAKVIDFASPGYVFTDSGNVGAGKWLKVGLVPSNVVGVNFGFFNGLLSNITVANETDPATFDVTLYEHDGTTFTLLATVSMVSVRSDEFDDTDFGTVNVTKGKELAVEISSGTAKNPIVTVQISGTLSP